MTDIQSILHALQRPRLLVRAARFGLDNYQRDRDLKRVLRTPRAPQPSSALKTLIEEEARLEQTRAEGDSTYSVSRHVDILIALMAEIRLLIGKGHAA